MCHNRLFGYHVVKSTKAVRFLWPQFTIAPEARIQRSEEHRDNVPRYPDPEHYLNKVQEYMFRNEQLRHLRLGQFFRYFYFGREEERQLDAEVAADPASVPDDATHRHYDRQSSRLPAGNTLAAAPEKRALSGATRRMNTNLCVPRSSFIEPYGEGRELFYEQRLLQGLPWYCNEIPRQIATQDENKELRWTFTTDAPNTPPALQSFSMVGRTLETGETFEQKCANLERAYSEEYKCPCRSLEAKRSICRTCLYAEGWHQCEKD